MADYVYLEVLSKGNSHRYVVPSFPVFKVPLREVKFRWDDVDGTVHVFDGFARADIDLLDHPLPAVAKVPVSNDHGFLIEREEFNKSINVSSYTLFEDRQVFVMWDWEWVDCSEDDDGDSVVASLSQDEHDESESQHSSDSEDMVPNITHTVIFKCIGATKEHRYQQLLGLAKQKKSVGETVPVKLEKEPSNPIDSQAIAFMCKADKEWERIGYVVKEALPDVHKAIDNNKIIKVFFDWIRFFKPPGLYAGISITLNGTWSNTVIQSSCGPR